MKKLLILVTLFVFFVAAVFVFNEPKPLPIPLNFCKAKNIHSPIKATGVSSQDYAAMDITPSGTVPGLWLINSHDIHIHNLKIHGNHNAVGIVMDNCYNVQIDTVTLDELAQGISIINENSIGSIHVNNNQGHNIFDANIVTNGRGHFIQFSHSTGPNNQIIGNNFQCDAPNAGTGDIISDYISGGTSSSPMLIENNNAINGGSGLGAHQLAAFIVICDNGGNYIHATGNTGVNTGYAGITVASGIGNYVSGNTIFSQSFSYSAVALTSANFTPSTGIGSSVITGNRVNWFSGISGHYRDTTWKPSNNTRPTGWDSNTIDRTLNATVLPSNIIQSCSDMVFLALATKTYGDADFSPGATSSNPITYVSSNASVATIISGQIHITGAGTSTITASDGITSIPHTLTVNKHLLAIIAKSAFKQQGTPNPALTATYLGFVNSETSAVLTTMPTISTTATTGSPANFYPITACCAVAANYTISYIPGILVVGNFGIKINKRSKVRTGVNY